MRLEQRLELVGIRRFHLRQIEQHVHRVVK
jgi:hypothetical protein